MFNVGDAVYWKGILLMIVKIENGLYHAHSPTMQVVTDQPEKAFQRVE